MNTRLMVQDALYGLIWAINNAFLALFVVMLWLGETTEQQVAGGMLALCLLPGTFWYATWMSVPSIFWRYKKVHETRVITDGKYSYTQIKIWGMWFNFMCDADKDQAQVALWSTPTVWDFARKNVYKSHDQVRELATYVKNGQTSGGCFEVLDRKKIINGKVE